jgi:hypothetical protein
MVGVIGVGSIISAPVHMYIYSSIGRERLALSAIPSSQIQNSILFGLGPSHGEDSVIGIKERI